jgi:hypothetical protein
VPIPFFITSEFKSDSICPPYLLPCFYEKETNLKTSNCVYQASNWMKELWEIRRGKKKEDKNQPTIEVTSLNYMQCALIIRSPLEV